MSLVMGAPILAYLLALSMIAVYDIRTLRAPNRFVYPLIVAGILAVLTLYRYAAVEALAGGLLSFSVLFAVALAGRGAMGFGDVKFGAACGLLVGLSGVFTMLASAFLAGAAVALFAVVVRGRNPQQAVAFTPFLFGGAVVALLTPRADFFA